MIPKKGKLYMFVGAHGVLARFRLNTVESDILNRYKHILGPYSEDLPGKTVLLCVYSDTVVYERLNGGNITWDHEGSIMFVSPENKFVFIHTGNYSDFREIK